MIEERREKEGVVEDEKGMIEEKKDEINVEGVYVQNKEMKMENMMMYDMNKFVK